MKMIFPTATQQPKRHIALAMALLLFSAALLWALLSPLVQHLKQAGVGGLELAFWRTLFAGGAFFVHGAFSNRLRLRSVGDFSPFLAVALLGVTGFYAAFALLFAPQLDVVGLFVYLTPLIIVAIAWLLLGRGNGLRRLNAGLTVVLAALIVTVVVGDPPQRHLPNLVWGVMVSVSLACYICLSHELLKRYPPVALHALGLPLGALGLWPLLNFGAKSPLVWLELIAVALLSSYLLYALYYSVLKFLGVGRERIVATAEPVAACLVAALFLASGVHWLGVLAAVLVLALAFVVPLGEKSLPVAAKRQFLKARASGAPHRVQIQA